MSTAKVLVVIDEDADFGWLISQLLATDGWQVNAFNEIAKASDALDTTSPTVILLNLQFEHGSGFECLHRWQGTLPCPIVAISALPSDAEQDKAQALGASAYLPKPFGYAQLQAVLQSVCTGAGP